MLLKLLLWILLHEVLVPLLCAAIIRPTSISLPNASGTNNDTNQWILSMASQPHLNASPYNPSVWIVELLANATINDFLTDTNLTGISFIVRQNFSGAAFHGLSVEVNFKSDPQQLLGNLQQIHRVNAVRHIWPSLRYLKPQVLTQNSPIYQPVAQSPALANLTGVYEAQTALNLSGYGIRVGIIDTGVDYTHPALGGGYGAGHQVEFGYDFVGDLYGDGTLPIPDSDPMDCDGHGTHVAGIIFANNDTHVSGVSPDVVVGAYKIFGCSGGTQDDIIIAALELALSDGMDVINLSLGGGPDWPEGPLATAIDRISKYGVIVVAAAGNGGDQGLYEVTSPSIAKSTTCVGSVDNLWMYVDYFVIGSQTGSLSADYIFDTSKPRPAAVFSGETRLIALPAAKSSGSNFGDGCSPIDSTISVAAKIVLVQRGSCLFSVKARNIQQAGGIGVVISDDTNETAVITPSVSDPTITIPVIFISEASAAFVFASMNATASGGAECILTWPGDQRIAVVGDGSVAISDFSSYGPSSDFTLKPDIAAPGGMIFSTFPVVQGQYATLSGTSMSSPYITGSYSLLLQGSDLLRQISPVSLRPLLAQILLQNTATPIHQPTLNSSGVITTILKQGAGLVNVHKALQARTLAIPSKLALGALPRTEDNGTVSDSIVATIQIVNLNNVTVDYALSSTPSEWINGSNPQSPQPLLLSSFNNVDVVVVSYSLSTLRVAASGVGSIDVTFKLNASMLPSLSTSDHWFFSGFLVIESNDTSTIRVPFVLESGSFKQQNALLSYPLPGSTTPFPQIFSPSTNATFTTSPTFPFQNFSSRIFTTAGNLGSLLPTFSFARLNQFSYDAPVIRFRLLYGSPLVIIRLLDANGTFVGEIARLTFIGRSDNSVTNGFLEVAWYGDIRISAIDVTPLPPPPTTIVSVYGTAASTHALSLMRRDGLTSNGASMFLQLHDALLAQLPSFSTSNDSTPTVGPLPLTSPSLVTNGIYSLELQVYSPQLGSNYFESWKSPFIRVLLSNGPA